MRDEPFHLPPAQHAPAEEVELPTEVILAASRTENPHTTVTLEVVPGPTRSGTCTPVAIPLPVQRDVDLQRSPERRVYATDGKAHIR